MYIYYRNSQFSITSSVPGGSITHAQVFKFHELEGQVLWVNSRWGKDSRPRQPTSGAVPRPVTKEEHS